MSFVLGVSTKTEKPNRNRKNQKSRTEKTAPFDKPMVVVLNFIKTECLGRFLVSLEKPNRKNRPAPPLYMFLYNFIYIRDSLFDFKNLSIQLYLFKKNNSIVYYLYIQIWLYLYILYFVFEQ